MLRWCSFNTFIYKFYTNQQNIASQNEEIRRLKYVKDIIIILCFADSAENIASMI